MKALWEWAHPDCPSNHTITPDHHHLTLSPTTGRAGSVDGNITSTGDKRIDSMHISFSCYLSLEKSKNYSPVSGPSLALIRAILMLITNGTGPVGDEKISCFAALTFNHHTLVGVRFAWHDPKNDKKVSICMYFINQNHWALLANHAFLRLL